MGQGERKGVLAQPGHHVKREHVFWSDRIVHGIFWIAAPSPASKIPGPHFTYALPSPLSMDYHIVRFYSFSGYIFTPGTIEAREETTKNLLLYGERAARKPALSAGRFVQRGTCAHSAAVSQPRGANSVSLLFQLNSVSLLHVIGEECRRLLDV